MPRVTHLIQNEYGVYCFRYTLPKWYQTSHPNDKKTILLSLKTKDFGIATMRVRQLLTYTRSILSKFKLDERTDEMPENYINSIIRDYRNYIAVADPNEQASVYLGTEKFEDIIEHLRHQLGFIEHHGLLKFVHADLDNIEKLYKRAKDTEALLEENDIATVLGEKSNVVETTVSPAPTSVNKSTKLSELLNEYAEEKASSVSIKTLDQTKGHIQFLISVVGDIEVVKFDETMLRKYREALNKRTAKRGGEVVAIKNLTKNEHLESCKQLFEHAKAFHISELTNLFKNQNVKFKLNKKEKSKRTPFNKDELERIFSHVIFTCDTGEYLHPYQYWAPLLALYTGSRANEIAQLRVDDIIVKDGVHCISHNMNTPDKKLKTADERDVPIHSKLKELGFLEYVELFKQKKYRWTDEKENHLLFKGLKLDKTRGGYAKELSRWFNGEFRKRTNSYIGFKHDIGINVKNGEKKDFHCFRHTFSTALQNAKVLDNLSYQMTGHSEGKQLLGGAGRGYRQGASMPVLYEELCKLDYGKPLENVKQFFELNGEKKCRNKIKAKL